MLSWPPATTIELSPFVDRLRAHGHRLEARAAEDVDAIGRDLDRHAGIDRGLPGRVLALAGVRIWPRITSETSPGSTLARSSTPWITVWPR
jgi:hypothetical protein